jgi:hypothetical protein
MAFDCGRLKEEDDHCSIVMQRFIRKLKVGLQLKLLIAVLLWNYNEQKKDIGDLYVYWKIYNEQIKVAMEALFLFRVCLVAQSTLPK